MIFLEWLVDNIATLNLSVSRHPDGCHLKVQWYQHLFYIVKMKKHHMDGQFWLVLLFMKSKMLILPMLVPISSCRSVLNKKFFCRFDMFVLIQFHTLWNLIVLIFIESLSMKIIQLQNNFDNKIYRNNFLHFLYIKTRNFNFWENFS